jgi:hypothetical protein
LSVVLARILRAVKAVLRPTQNLVERVELATLSLVACIGIMTATLWLTVRIGIK